MKGVTRPEQIPLEDTEGLIILLLISLLCNVLYLLL